MNNQSQVNKASRFPRHPVSKNSSANEWDSTSKSNENPWGINSLSEEHKASVSVTQDVNKNEQIIIPNETIVTPRQYRQQQSSRSKSNEVPPDFGSASLKISKNQDPNYSSNHPHNFNFSKIPGTGKLAYQTRDSIHNTQQVGTTGTIIDSDLHSNGNQNNQFSGTNSLDSNSQSSESYHPNLHASHNVVKAAPIKMEPSGYPSEIKSAILARFRPDISPPKILISSSVFFGDESNIEDESARLDPEVLSAIWLPQTIQIPISRTPFTYREQSILESGHLRVTPKTPGTAPNLANQKASNPNSHHSNQNINSAQNSPNIGTNRSSNLGTTTSEKSEKASIQGNWRTKFNQPHGVSHSSRLNEDDGDENQVLWDLPADETKLGSFDENGNFSLVSEPFKFKKTNMAIDFSSLPGHDRLPPPGLANFTAKTEPLITPATNWMYRDPSGTIQGPFNTAKMHGWSLKNFFPDSLLLRRAQDDSFLTLEEWKKRIGGMNPFDLDDKLSSINRSPSPFSHDLLESQSTLAIQKLNIGNVTLNAGLPSAQSVSSITKQPLTFGSHTPYSPAQLNATNPSNHDEVNHSNGAANIMSRLGIAWNGPSSDDNKNKPLEDKFMTPQEQKAFKVETSALQADQIAFLKQFSSSGLQKQSPSISTVSNPKTLEEIEASVLANHDSSIHDTLLNHHVSNTTKVSDETSQQPISSKKNLNVDKSHEKLVEKTPKNVNKVSEVTKKTTNGVNKTVPPPKKMISDPSAIILATPPAVGWGTKKNKPISNESTRYSSEESTRSLADIRREQELKEQEAAKKKADTITMASIAPKSFADALRDAKTKPNPILSNLKPDSERTLNSSKTAQINVHQKTPQIISQSTRPATTEPKLSTSEKAGSINVSLQDSQISEKSETVLSWCKKQFEPLSEKYDIGLCSMLVSELKNGDEIEAFVSDNMPLARKMIDVKAFINGIERFHGTSTGDKSLAATAPPVQKLYFSEKVQENEFNVVKSKRKTK